VKLNLMEIATRKYESSDVTCIPKFVEGSQDYLASIDNMKRMRRMPDYGESYAGRLLEKMGKSDGMAYVATTHKNQIIGFIAGLIERQPADDLPE
jgi:hypothetical protein